MPTKLMPLTLAVTILALAGCGSGGSSSSSGSSGSRVAGAALPGPVRTYRVVLSGVAETPRGAPNGTGDAIIAFHGTSTVCWRFAHLHGFTNATFAHIHAATKGKAGKIVVPLSTGPRLRHQGCVPATPALVSAIVQKPQDYYVNIHSARYPGGAVRAQL
jgi:CHRD domain